MTVAIRTYSYAELDQLQDQLRATNSLPVEDIARLLTGYAWLLGATKGQDEVIAQLRAESDEDDALRSRLASLLTRTANALKGEPEPLHQHDWSDLPDVAARAIEALRLLGSDFQWRTASVEKRMAVQRPLVSLARKVETGFALGRIAKALGIPGPDYDGLTAIELAQKIELMIEARDLELQNAGSDETCRQLLRAFDEIDTWLAGTSDKTEPPEFFFGSPAMNKLWRRYATRGETTLP